MSGAGRWGRLYFGAQAVAGAAWWVGVFTVPAIREATLGGIDPVLMAALDVPLFVVASLLAAFGLRWAVWVVVPWTALVTLGMVAYATLTTEAGWGTVLMACATAAGVWAGCLVLLGRFPAEVVLRGPFGFRVAAPAPTGSHVRTTGAQLVFFWGTFLALIPLALLVLEQRWQLHAEAPLGVRVAGFALLVAASGLGLWSAWSMSTRGQGTPLPSRTAQRLVVAGPYRFVRNPMALAGIAQGAAIGLMMSSWIVVLYALAGSVVWNTFVRPAEEADLEARFGEEFAAYRAAVPVWVPRVPSARDPRVMAKRTEEAS